MPGGATSALFQLGPAMSLDVLAGHTAAAVLLALAVTPRRDVL